MAKHLSKVFLIWLAVAAMLLSDGECARGGGGGGRRGGGRKGTKYGMRMPILIRPRNQEAGNYYEHKDGARIIKSSHFELDYMLGRKITFFCMAKGLPRPEITWFKDGIELYAHKFFQVATKPVMADDENVDDLKKNEEQGRNEENEEEEEEQEEEEDDNEEERESKEEKGEEEDREEDRKKGQKSYFKRYFDELDGEEFDGEGYYPPTPPSDFELLMGAGDVAREPSETIREEEKQEPEGVEEPEESEMKGEEESIAGEEPEVKSEREYEKTSLTTTSSFEYGTRISEYFMQPKEKTPSELQFESEYREVVEEKMKKIMQPMEEEEKEKKEEARSPLEKKKLLIAEVDVSGLYPTPKVIESEVSFAFDEDEEGEKGYRSVQTEADFVQYIMDVVRDSLKYDSDNIFAKNAKDLIQKMKAVVEEIVTSVRKGISINIQQKVDENLPHFKSNLKNTLIIRLKEKLEKFERALEAEEEEEGKVPEIEKGAPKKKKKFKVKSIKKIEEPAGLTTEISQEKILKVDEETLLEEEEKEESVELLAKIKTTGEEESEKGEEQEIEGEAVIPYEKIDWQNYLTESERQLGLDPALRSEMELYLARRKEELDKDQKVQAEKKERKNKYKKPKDWQEELKNANLNVTMKFVLNTGNVFTCAYRYFMPFGEIKEDLAGIFRVPPDVFIIYRDEVEVKDDQTAFDLKPEIEPFESVTFRLVTLDNDRWQLRSDHLELPVPDIITCTVETGEDHEGTVECKDVVVEIEDRKIKKPFVGGYRDCSTGVEYHHAFSQSAPHPPKLPWDRRVSRDTQTAFTKIKLIDTTSEKSTQMARRDYFVSTEEDKIISAKPYVDYETWCKKRNFEGKVKTIQRYVRAMILRRFLRKMSQEYRERKCWELEQEKKRIRERENRIKMDIINMTYPKTKADFDMLYALVEKWRKAQIERVSNLKTEAPKKAELCTVLEKEIKLLEAIEVHRIAINKERKRVQALNFMEKVAKPVTWTGYRGITVKMDTLKTQRARELKELYQSLSRHDLDHRDRIELLVTLKYALRVHNTRAASDLTDLLNQECEMMIRGAKQRDLEYLRQRIEHSFAENFKDPSFNPEAAKYDPALNKGPLRGNILFCKLCHQMKSLEDFSATTREKTINACSACRWLHNIAVPRIDLNPFRYILRTVRRDEQKRNCYSSCAFVLQDEDMHFLVQNIWRNRSAVSENDNLIDLRMPRWNTNEDWTPWNCILLTEAEAKAHLKTKPEDNYEPHLIGEIVSKHEMAKRHFQQLFATTSRLRDSGRWANVVDAKKYVPPDAAAELWDPNPTTHPEDKMTCYEMTSIP